MTDPNLRSILRQAYTLTGLAEGQASLDASAALYVECVNLAALMSYHIGAIVRDYEHLAAEGLPVAIGRVHAEKLRALIEAEAAAVEAERKAVAGC